MRTLFRAMLQNLLYSILMVYFLNNVVVLVMHRYESKRLYRSCFSVNFAKFLGDVFLWNIFEHVLLKSSILLAYSLSRREYIGQVKLCLPMLHFLQIFLHFIISFPTEATFNPLNNLDVVFHLQVT